MTGRGVELGPAVGPGGAGDGNQRGVEAVDRVAAVGDGGERTGRTPRRSVIGGGRCDSKDGAARPQAASASAWPIVRGQREGGMGGEHRGEARAFHQRAIFGPADRAVVGIGTQQMLCEAGQHGVVRGLVDAADVVGEAARRDRRRRRRADGGSGRRQLSSVSSPSSMRRVMARATSRTGLPKGSSSARAPRRAVSSRSSWARAAAGSGIGTSGMPGSWRDLCGAARRKCGAGNCGKAFFAGDRGAVGARAAAYPGPGSDVAEPRGGSGSSRHQGKQEGNADERKTAGMNANRAGRFAPPARTSWFTKATARFLATMSVSPLQSVLQRRTIRVHPSLICVHLRSIFLPCCPATKTPAGHRVDLPVR